MTDLQRQTQHLLVARPYPRKLSLVIPAYNEEAAIPLLRKEIQRFVAGLRCEAEIVIVNDGSCDGTIALLAEWAQADLSVKVIHLSRNFGHQIAATAGLDYATGEAIVLIDADLQDPLDVIPRMIERYCEGYDLVYGLRESRLGETILKRFTAWAFYRLMQVLVYRDLPVDAGDFRLVSRDFLSTLQSMREQHRFLRGMTRWVGCPQIAERYQRQERRAGTTKYPMRRMLTLAWTAATSFSTLPLRISMLLGLLVGVLGMEEAIRAIWVYAEGKTVQGWSSLMVVLCAVSSSLLVSLGVLGDYVGKIYEQVKKRPLYVVSRTFNLNAADRSPRDTTGS